jgi:hypothetical protein
MIRRTEWNTGKEVWVRPSAVVAVRDHKNGGGSFEVILEGGTRLPLYGDVQKFVTEVGGVAPEKEPPR